MPFYKPHPKGDMQGKKNQLRKPDIQTWESEKAKETITGLIHLNVIFLFIAFAVPGTACLKELGIIKLNSGNPSV